MPFNKPKILKRYRIAGIFYLLPFALAFLFALDNYTAKLASGFLLAVFLCSAIPSTLMGLVWSILGIRGTRKHYAPQTADTGITLIYAGVFLIIIWLFVYGIVYLAIN